MFNSKKAARKVAILSAIPSLACVTNKYWSFFFTTQRDDSKPIALKFVLMFSYENGPTNSFKSNESKYIDLANKKRINT